MSSIVFNLDERMRFDGLASPLLPVHGHSKTDSTSIQGDQQKVQQSNGHFTGHTPSGKGNFSAPGNNPDSNTMNKRLAPPVPPKNPLLRVALPAMPGDDST